MQASTNYSKFDMSNNGSINPVTLPGNVRVSHVVKEYSVVSSIITFVKYERLLAHRESIHGPINRTKFMLVIVMMTFCSSNNDFVAKLCYQSVLGNEYFWLAGLLTFSSFFICSFGIIFGWNDGNEWHKLKQNKLCFLAKIIIAGSCDVLTNFARYIGLIFLSASVVTVLYYGFQLLFSTIFRLRFELNYGSPPKSLSNLQSVGIVFIIIGLGLVCGCCFLTVSHKTDLFGILIIFLCGLFGSIRCSFEQILCRDNGYNSNFIVGFRSIISILWMLIVAALVLSYNNEWNKTEIYDDGIKYIFSNRDIMFLIFLILLMIVIYIKNVCQMKVIKLSSALTRNLTMQFTAIFTWILSLFAYYAISNSFGEQWHNYSYIRLIGFCITLSGSYLYLRIPNK